MISAEITESLAKSSNLYVEIKLDGSAMQRTSVIEGDTAPFWNEEFRVYVSSSPGCLARLIPHNSNSRCGNTFSTISLSVEEKLSPCGNRSIGHASINIGALMDACSEYERTYDENIDVMHIL